MMITNPDEPTGGHPGRGFTNSVIDAKTFVSAW
jgi:hypothetical protein